MKTGRELCGTWAQTHESEAAKIVLIWTESKHGAANHSRRTLATDVHAERFESACIRGTISRRGLREEDRNGVQGTVLAEAAWKKTKERPDEAAEGRKVRSKSDPGGEPQAGGNNGADGRKQWELAEPELERQWQRRNGGESDGRRVLGRNIWRTSRGSVRSLQFQKVTRKTRRHNEGKPSGT